jgi:hypothetical protein
VEELFNKNSEEWVVIPNYDVPVSEVKEVYEQKHTKDRGVLGGQIDEQRIYIYDKPYKNYMD